MTKKILMIGIAGSNNDFLLSLPTLKAYLYQFDEIKDEYDIIIKNYHKDTFKITKDIDYNKIAKEIIGLNPDILCFSCYVWNMKGVKILSSMAKHEFPGIKIIWGGPEITKENYENGSYVGLPVDHLVFGEGEKELYKILTGNDAPIQDYKDYPSPYLTGCVPEELFENKEFRLSIETQRGCPYKCSYCLFHRNFNGIKYRNANVVIDELEYCYKKEVKMGKIVDADFFSDIEFAKKILRGIIDKNIRMELYFDALAVSVDSELTDLCKEYTSISKENKLIAGIGLQSTNQEVLKAIGRPLDLNGLKKSMKLLSSANMTVRLDLILGLPKDTKERYIKSLDYVIGIMKLGNHLLGLLPLAVLSGSRLWDEIEKYGLVIGKKDWHAVYETNTFPRKDIVECLRLNTIVYRIFNWKETHKEKKLCDIFFSIEGTNIEKVYKIYPLFFEYLKKKGSRFAESDYPDAENYYLKEVFTDVSNEDMIKFMKEVIKENA